MNDMVEYLSEEWFREADAEVAALSPIPSPVTVVVEVGARRGHGAQDVTYRLVLGPDRVRVLAGEPGSDGDAADGHVTLTMTYETASAIAQGKIGAQRAFLDGDVRLGGDTTALLGHQARLAEIEDRLSDLRSRTRY